MMKKCLALSTLILLIIICITSFNTVSAAPSVTVNVEGADNVADSLQILFLLTVMSFAPSILIMMTGFTRIVIVLSFLRNALGLQQTPPNQVMIGLALFITLFVMMPVFNKINTEAYIPYRENKITQEQAVQAAITPLREFMLKQTNAKDLNLFLNLAHKEKPSKLEEIPTEVIIPSFIISELKRAFIIGFLLFIPFLIIDMVVASTLMAMGMVMLPPVMISMPFKILLFILVDGWGLIVSSLITSFK